MIISQSLLLWGQGLWKFKNSRLKRSTHDYFTYFAINAAEGIEFLFGNRVMFKLGRIVWKAKTYPGLDREAGPEEDMFWD